MPGGDRTGPTGMGPMTGRGAGYCAGYPAPGFASFGYGAGFRGRGRGRGRWNWGYGRGGPGWARAGWGWPAYGVGEGYAASQAPAFAPSATSGEQQVNALKQQAEELARALDDIKKRVAELETQPQGE